MRSGLGCGATSPPAAAVVGWEAGSVITAEPGASAGLSALFSTSGLEAVRLAWPPGGCAGFGFANCSIRTDSLRAGNFPDFSRSDFSASSTVGGTLRADCSGGMMMDKLGLGDVRVLADELTGETVADRNALTTSTGLVARECFGLSTATT
jgi:hypothetical protein